MVIDCHGHPTTSPPQHAHLHFRQRQLEGLADRTLTLTKGSLDISDDDIRASLAPHQLRLKRERGTGLTLFSPRAAGMGHHVVLHDDAMRVYPRLRRASEEARVDAGEAGPG